MRLLSHITSIVILLVIATTHVQAQWGADTIDAGGATEISSIMISMARKTLSPPQITLLTPTKGMVVDKDKPVTLVASALDEKEGDISDRIRWRSSLSGDLGIGAKINVMLQPGFQFIYASVDNASGIGSAAPSVDILASDTTNTYCDSRGLVATEDWIESLVIGDFINVSGQNNGLGNFVTAPLKLRKGFFYNTLTTPGGLGRDVAPEGWRIWIDFNHDLQFSDNERVFSAFGMDTQYCTINIPSNALNGHTRMRVSMQFNTPQVATCGAFVYGEVEDYTIDIL